MRQKNFGWNGYLLRVILVCVILTICTEDAQAIPAFARKYQTGCITCHSMTPRLHAFGEAFRLNGFRFVDDELYIKEEPLEMADEAYKRLWPNAIWPSDIPGTLPLAIRNRTFFRSISKQGDTIDKVDWEWEVFTAGTMGEDLSAFGHFNVEGSVAPFEEAEDKEKVKTKVVGWFTFENLGDNLGLANEDLINLQVGIVGIEEHDLPHYRSHSTYRLDTTKSFYTGMKIPYPSGFREKNQYKLRRGPGAMLYGFTSRLQYALGWEIGNQEGAGTDQQVGFFSMAYKIGGMDLYGRTEDELASGEFPSSGHLENSLGLGMFASFGDTKVQETASTSRETDSFHRLGFDVRLRREKFILHAGTLFGSNDNPYGTLNSGGVDVRSWFIAPEYYWYPWLLTGLRYEEEVIDVPSSLGLGDRTRARFHPYIAILYRANFRITIESNIYTDKRKDGLDNNSIGIVFDFTF